MGILKQAGKKKKIEQKSRAGEAKADLVQTVPKRDELEKTMFLSPEERIFSKEKGVKRAS